MAAEEPRKIVTITAEQIEQLKLKAAFPAFEVLKEWVATLQKEVGRRGALPCVRSNSFDSRPRYSVRLVNSRTRRARLQVLAWTLYPPQHVAHLVALTDDQRKRPRVYCERDLISSFFWWLYLKVPGDASVPDDACLRQQLRLLLLWELIDPAAHEVVFQP